VHPIGQRKLLAAPCSAPRPFIYCAPVLPNTSVCCAWYMAGLDKIACFYFLDGPTNGAPHRHRWSTLPYLVSCRRFLGADSLGTDVQSLSASATPKLLISPLLLTHPSRPLLTISFLTLFAGISFTLSAVAVLSVLLLGPVAFPVAIAVVAAS